MGKQIVRTSELERFRISDIEEHCSKVASGNRALVFDTTLRDGEQTPGVALNGKQKSLIAEQLAPLGVDIIESGFPASGESEFDGVHGVAKAVGRTPRNINGELVAPPVIAAMARATKRDIELAWKAIEPAIRPRVHIVLASSDTHLEFKLKKTRAQVLDMAIDSVKLARSFCNDVEFSPEDASRSDVGFLTELIHATIDAGATTINITDTVGYSTPEEFGDLIGELLNHVPQADRTVFSVHCHDDLGLATSNTLSGLVRGARQAEVTINGVGERAGNTCLEEVVMALETRSSVYGLETGIVTQELTRTSKLVAEKMGLPVQANKAIVGANAFSHESGIHQDGMLKNRGTYEIISPASVGRDHMQLVIGKHSGRKALQFKLESLGIQLTAEQLNLVFSRFKQKVSDSSSLSNQELIALASNKLSESCQAI